LAGTRNCVYRAVDGDDAATAGAFVKKLQRRFNKKRNDSDDEAADVAEDAAPAPKEGQPADGRVKTDAA
jgi:hypothetical protein